MEKTLKSLETQKESTKPVGLGLGIKCTAVLLSYKRPNELSQIVENLHQYDFIDEIIVAINKPDTNLKCLRRWLTALQAKNDLIYFQDDDCIVTNLNELYEEYDGSGAVIGVKGTRIIEFINKSEGLVGWGAFLDKNWINADKYLDKYGADDLLVRDADRIFTYIIGKNRPHNYQVSEVIDFPSANGDMAMYMEQSHWDSKEQAIKRVKELYD